MTQFDLFDLTKQSKNGPGVKPEEIGLPGAAEMPQDGSSSTGTFYNTIHLKDESLEKEKSAAKTQERAILWIFFRHNAKMTPFEVSALLGDPWPITSVRRAINTLTEQGLLEKCDEMRNGQYGKPNHTWRLVGGNRGKT